jgi:serine/threonine protein phosphatase PrpC
MRSPLEQSLTVENSDVVILTTDGVKENFDPEDYPQMHSQKAITIARNIVQRFGKSYDDATCIVLRWQR